jgi:hypothetical protein
VLIRRSTRPTESSQFIDGDNVQSAEGRLDEGGVDNDDAWRLRLECGLRAHLAIV